MGNLLPPSMDFIDPCDSLVLVTVKRTFEEVETVARTTDLFGELEFG